MGLFPWLCKLSQLQMLDVSFNKHNRSISDCIFQMSNLVQLDLIYRRIIIEDRKPILYSNHFNGRTLETC